jgi:DNA replication and repair protein RecF
VFTGQNAQGKTNFLEAVYFTSIGRSMRTPRDKELIMWGSDKARIRSDVVGRGGKSRVEIVLDKNEKKRVAIGGARVSKMGELMGVIMTVLFSPDEIAIIKQGPGERRRFMDIAICQLSRTYFYLLTRYNKVLGQRNSLLKSKADASTLDVWDIQLAQTGAKVIKTRRGFIARLNELARRNHEFLTNGKESLTLRYEGIDGASEEEITQNFLASLKRSRDKDLLHGYTHVGAQTDDFGALVGDVDVRKFGSQGQQRTVALSLKLAQLDLFTKKRASIRYFYLTTYFPNSTYHVSKNLFKKLMDFRP